MFYKKLFLCKNDVITSNEQFLLLLNFQKTSFLFHFFLQFFNPKKYIITIVFQAQVVTPVQIPREWVTWWKGSTRQQRRWCKPDRQESQGMTTLMQQPTLNITVICSEGKLIEWILVCSKNIRFDFDDELKIGDVTYDNVTKIIIKEQLFWRLPYET